MSRLDLDRPPGRPALRSGPRVEGESSWPLSRVFSVGATVAAVVVLVVLGTGSFALWQLVTVRTVAAQVGTPGLLAGQRLSVALVNEESGLRGFAATGRQEFLEPYRSGLDEERAAVAVLRRLAPRGLTDFTPAVEAVERAAASWRADYADPVIAGVVPAPAPEVGKDRFDRVRMETASLISYLDMQRTTMAGRADDAVSFLIVASTVIAVLFVVVVVATGIGLRRAVLRPMSELAEQVRDVVTGGVHRDVKASGPREIVELGADVDAMRVHILRDLDESQEANKRLDAQTQELERSNRDLEQFAYVASHDLQEPLRKVSSFCQLLQRRYGGQLDERADQYIGFAVDGAQRMQQLINDLLAFSRVGRSSEGFTPVDLSAVVAVAASQLETTRSEVGGTFEIGELPVVAGDQPLLRQLLLNLLGNGLKFHREGVPPVVRVQAVREDDFWRIDVIDNGIGIEPDYADKIFVIFQRLHGRDSYPGTGIGLALAKKIVEFHGGRIALASSTGPGTTIEFTLAVPVEAT